MGDAFEDRLKDAERRGLDGAARRDRATWSALLALGACMVVVGVGATVAGLATSGGSPPPGATTCWLAGLVVACLSRRPGWTALKACTVAVVATCATTLAFLVRDGAGLDATSLEASVVVLLGTTTAACALSVRVTTATRVGFLEARRLVDALIADEVARVRRPQGRP